MRNAHELDTNLFCFLLCRTLSTCSLLKALSFKTMYSGDILSKAKRQVLVVPKGISGMMLVLEGKKSLGGLFSTLYMHVYEHSIVGASSTF